MDRAELTRWLDRYERAWRTPGTGALSEVFARDARYRFAPFEEPRRGLDAIAALWERERQSPDETFEMRYEIVAVEGDTGVARVDVRYDEPPRVEYRDVWIVRLDEQGRCVEFEEWPFSPPGQKGSWPPGPANDAA